MEQIHGRHLSRSRAGTTITELMVATIILSVGILGLFGAFRYISISLNVSRAQTLAANLAQERVEVLKNYNYYGLLITTSTQYDTRFTPNIPYDTGNYPPENISIGNMNFTRYTYVTMANVTNGTIQSVGSDYPDTGLKQMAVNVVWTTANGGIKKWTLTNLLENPNVNPLDATMSGNVYITGGGGPLASAQVFVEQNPDWSGTTNVGGAYSFQVYHGTYTVRVSSAGFYDTVSSMSVVNRGGTSSTNLALEKISTGNVAGIAWYNSDLVVSQVVASTMTKAGDGNIHNVEYVELFNPTTFTINLHASGDSWNTPGTAFMFYIQNNGGGNNWACDCNIIGTNMDAVHVSTFVAPGHYYLIANTTSFFINGVNLVADEYYDHTGAGFPKYLGTNTADSVALYHWYSGNFADYVGWTDNGGHNPAYYYWPYVPNYGGGNGPGDPQGQQIVRVSSPVASMADITTYGRAYNSQSNQNDFLWLNGGDVNFVTPRNSAAGTFPVISGKVPSGVVVSASDPHSSSLTAFSSTISSGSLNLSYVPFKLTGVTTGTYTVALSFTGGSPVATYSQILSNVNITQNQTIAVPNATTSPIWTPPNYYQVQLSSTPDTGFVKGTVTDSYNNPINGITVQSGGFTKVTGSDGKYFMNVTSGTITLTANPNNSNQAYVQQVMSVTVAQGAITQQDFILSLGARITGGTMIGSTPVPNVVVNATVGGNQVASATSDGTGVFTLRNMSTGTYTITPVLDLGQDASPNSIGPVTVNSTGSVFIGTFTISGAYGSISGNVTDNSSLVTSGALIIASTNTISSSPPSIAASSAPAQTPYYMISSKADGTYSLPVRGGSTYNLSAYVPTVSASGVVSITTKTYSGIAVSVGGSVTKNVVIP